MNTKSKAKENSKSSKTTKIHILVTDYCMASSIAGLKDLFAVANYSAKEMGATTDIFKVEVITPTGEAVTAYNGDKINPTIRIDFSRSRRQIDCLIIAPIMNATAPPKSFEKQLQALAPLIKWIQNLDNKATYIASACTGSFFLAEAGLLNAKDCTTHWRAAHVFRQRYPKVILKEDELIIRNGNLLCAGGAVSYLDLGLHIISDLYSVELSNTCAKLLVFDPARDKQSPYQSFSQQKKHNDEAIAKAQEWMEANYHTTIVIDELGEQFGMSTRTFKRRFKAATNDSPNSFLQKVRIESAKNQLAMTRNSSQMIIWNIGYEDISSFRRLFKKHVGMTMDEYRKRFSQ